MKKNVRLLTENEQLLIPGLDGQITFTDTHHSFEFWVESSSGFKKHGLSLPGPATEEALIDICEVGVEGYHMYLDIFFRS